MTVFTVGKASIARIEETYGPTYRAGDIFPEFDDKVLAKHAGWLAPSHYDAASGFIKLSVHSWLLQIGNQKILIDGCCGNNKIKPARPFWNMLNIPYLERLAAAAETTVATLLPGVEFLTRSPYPDARRLIDAGVSIALASDCNPGTCYSSSIPFVLALAVREMRLTPAEALLAATSGSAKSLRRKDIGVICPGNRADLTVLDAPSYLHLFYRAGVPIVRVLDPAGRHGQ